MGAWNGVRWWGGGAFSLRAISGIDTLLQARHLFFRLYSLRVYSLRARIRFAFLKALNWEPRLSLRDT